jgi:uncharacterized protein (TIGR02145 family)
MEQMNKTVVMFLAVAAACQAQTFNISGAVKTIGGNGIEGVTVRLGKAGLSTATGPNGSFTLAGTVTGAHHPTGYSSFHRDRLFNSIDGRLHYKAAGQAAVKAVVYDCNGRVLVSLGMLAVPGNNTMPLPHFGSGIQICRVSMNAEQYTFKCVSGTAANRTLVSLWKGRASSWLAKATGQIDDALVFTKDGYQVFRLAVTKSDTSGLQITMAPLETGTVTDADGQVYKTVRYGNQVWTVENLRTTKNNDGTVIPLITDNDAWNASNTPARCFYDTLPDTAAQRKWGALYNWYSVKTGKLAPAGWHVSTDADWDTLQNYLIARGCNSDGTTVGNKIAKSMASKTDWLPGTDSGAVGNDTGRNNASGFSGLPAGYYGITGSAYTRSWYAFWWTATVQDSSSAKARCLTSYYPDLRSETMIKTYGLSVRLVRDR